MDLACKESNDQQYAKSIELPPDDVFKDLHNVKRFAIDIGGSLAKIVYLSEVEYKKRYHFSKCSDDPNKEKTGFTIEEQVESSDRLHFVKFETKYIEECLNFIERYLLSRKGSRQSDEKSTCKLSEEAIKATGGGAHKYKDILKEKLGVDIEKMDEMQCLINGCNFLLKHIPNECFQYVKSEFIFPNLVHEHMFPYLLVNIGSGVSIVKVEGPQQFERIGGTSTGGGTFWGLGSLLTNAQGFDELLSMTTEGKTKNIDMLVKDIYGGAYSEMNLPPELVASSFGKATRASREDTESVHTKDGFRQQDIAKALLRMISNDIGQISSLYAQLHGLTRIIFGGYFIRGHPVTMDTISYAINFFSKGKQQALFLRHEGYLGAIGAFVSFPATQLNGKSSWNENFAATGFPSDFRKKRATSYDMFQLDRIKMCFDVCPLLVDPSSYEADLIDLAIDEDSRAYWLDLFEGGTDNIVKRAVSSQSSQESDAVERGEQFKKEFVDKLKRLKEMPYAFGQLTIRSLLDMREQYLIQFSFCDPFLQTKQMENNASLQVLEKRLEYIDSLSGEEKHLEIIEGMVAGNIFDWGAKESLKYLQDDVAFGLNEARQKIQRRPWLKDDVDKWIKRLEGPAHPLVVVFVDNSGADVVLGILPFVRDILQRGSKVILAANSYPAINDITFSELSVVCERAGDICPIIKSALSNSKLTIMETGSSSPCIDLRRIEVGFASIIKDADLIVLEGMGRAILTNYNAGFTCESLKFAVLKNPWVALKLGGDLFNVVFKYEDGAT